MQNSEAPKISTTMTAIQGGEGSPGDGSRSFQPVELKDGGDGVTDTASVDGKPLTVVGHKRKASSEIDPHSVNSPDPVLSPIVEQHAEMVTQGEDSEEVEGHHNIHRGILLDLNQGPEEMDNYRYDDVFREKKETVAKDNIEVKPESEKLYGRLSDFDLNQEGKADSNSDQEKENVETCDMENPDDVESEEDKGIPHGELSEMDKNQGEGTVKSTSDVEKEQVETDSVESIEVEPYVGENLEVMPYIAENIEVAIKKIEGEPSTIVENTEVTLPASENKQVEPASPVDKIALQLNSEPNKESDPFSDDEVKAKTSALHAEKNEGESTSADKVEVETHIADKNEVDADADVDAADKVEVKPYAVAPEKKNEEVEVDAAEKAEVVAHVMDPEKKNKEVEVDAAEKAEVVAHVMDPEKKNKEVEADAVEKVEAKPSPEKHEAGPSTTEENEMEIYSPVRVHGLLRGPVNFDLDLNEIPSMEEEE